MILKLNDLRFVEEIGWVGSNGFKRFSASVHGEQEKANAWLQAHGAELVSALPPLRIHAEGIRFDAFMATRFTTHAAHALWRRDRMRARRRFVYIFTSRGTVTVTTRGQHANSGTGLSLIFPGDSPVEFRTSNATDAVVFSFDRDEIGDLADAIPTEPKLSRNSSVFRASYAYLCGLLHPSDVIDAGTDEVLRDMTRSIARALATASTQSDLPRLRFIDQGLRRIALRAHQPGTNATTIAAELGVSRRTLERAFAAAGKQVSLELRNMRTTRALELITEDPDEGLAVVAQRSGFTSAATMRRAFQEELGLTPRDAQMRARRLR